MYQGEIPSAEQNGMTLPHAYRTLGTMTTLSGVFLTLLTLTSLGAATSTNDKASKTIWIAQIGFSETEIRNDESVPASDPRIVPLFAQVDGKWTRDFKDPVTVRWWEIFDGKSTRALETSSKNDMEQAKDEVHRRIGARLAIHLGESGQNHATISRLTERVSLGLNLFASTNPRVTDPGHWQRVRPDRDRSTTVKNEFLRAIPFRRRCVRDDKDPDWHVSVPTKERLKLSELKIDPRSFRSRRGELILGVYVDVPLCLDDPYVIRPYYQKHWYLVTKAHAREILPGSDRRHSVEPIEAADFDGDGKSEWVFRENGSGAGDMGSTTFVLLDEQLNEITGNTSPLPGVPGEDRR